jgi:hypothetical protein
VVKEQILSEITILMRAILLPTPRIAKKSFDNITIMKKSMAL